MPKTRPLTQGQREDEAQNKLCREIMDRLNETRGRDRQSNEAFAKRIGVSDFTWRRWNNGQIALSEISRVVLALHRVGYRLNLEAVST